MRILVVEDNRSLLKTLKKGLVEESFAVDTAEDGEEGLYLAGINDYDIVILDLLLPKIDGWTVLREMRAKGLSTQCPDPDGARCAGRQGPRAWTAGRTIT